MIRFMILCYMPFFIVAYKSLILKPGGLKGFYMTGICQYIKQHYDLSDWNYYGASAGSWNALYMSCSKGDIFINHATQLNQFSYNDLYDLERTIKKRILKEFTIHDFDLSKLHICVSTKRKYVPLLRKQINHDFRDLDDLVECCIASSHLPLISNGNFFYKYRNIPSLDGGFFKNPHKHNIVANFIIQPEMWNNKKTEKMNRVFTMDIEGLIYEGYNDACKHHMELDEVFKSV